MDRRKKSSDVPAIPDVPQAAEDILKSIAPEIEKLISERLAGTTPGRSKKPSNFLRGKEQHMDQDPSRALSVVMIATHLQPRLHEGEQEERHTSKKSRLSHPPLELFQPKILSKNNSSPVSSDISSHSSSDSVTWEKPQTSKHHASIFKLYEAYPTNFPTCPTAGKNKTA